MADWERFGDSVSESVAKELTPKNLHDELGEYRQIFGKEFTLADLINIKKVEAIGRLAGAIENAPELLFHEAAVSGEQAPIYVTLDGDLDVTKG